MRKPPNKLKDKKPVPPRTKSGLKVYYDDETEHFLREEARKHGFRNVQEYLKFKARQERLAQDN